MKNIPILFSMIFFSVITASHAQKMPRTDVVEFPAHQNGLHAHHLFQSNMVLQRDQPIAIWGWASPNEAVSVTLDNTTQKTLGSKEGSWKVTFPARPANTKPITIKVQGKTKTISMNNILIGDVWILAGQSNMEFELSKVENGKLEIVSSNYPEIRILSLPHDEGTKAKQNFARLHQWSDWSSRHFRKGDWDVCAPEITKELSAIGYTFARRIHMASRIPIGVIDTSRGGTTVETWTPKSVLNSMKSAPVKNLLATWDQKVADYDPKADIATQVKRYESKVAKLKKQGKDIPSNMKKPTEARPGPDKNHNYPGSCYNGMIAPIAGIRVKGAIFHQGFNNCFSGTEGAKMYRDVFPKMIKAWRKAFQDPEMPFGILSLCTAGTAQTSENYTQSMHDTGAYIRAAQYETFVELLNAGDDNIGFTSTYDLRRRWYHPQLKMPAGERIARWALATEYGFSKDLQWKPATIKEMKIEGDRIILTFDQTVSNVDNGHVMEGFAIAGDDRKFHPATITHLVTGKDNRKRDIKDQKSLVLRSPMVSQPKHYRYAWARNPMANIQNTRNSDIPLATQRSDDWDLEETPLIKYENADKVPSKRDIQNALKAEDLRRSIQQAEALLKEHNHTKN